MHMTLVSIEHTELKTAGFKFCGPDLARFSQVDLITNPKIYLLQSSIVSFFGPML